MARKKLFQTKDFCDVHIRKNTISTYNGITHYRHGMYFPRTSIVGLKMPAYECLNHPDFENRILETLLHEINHWATYLFLDRADWILMARGFRGRKHDDRLVEKIANWPLEGY